MVTGTMKYCQTIKSEQSNSVSYMCAPPKQIPQLVAHTTIVVLTSIILGAYIASRDPVSGHCHHHRLRPIYYQRKSI